MKRIIDIDEKYYEIVKFDVEKGMDYLPCKLIANSKPLQTELEEIKAEINEYLIASFADDEDFRWFNLCLDAHIKENKNE